MCSAPMVQHYGQSHRVLVTLNGKAVIDHENNYMANVFKIHVEKRGSFPTKG